MFRKPFAKSKPKNRKTSKREGEFKSRNFIKREREGEINDRNLKTCASCLCGGKSSR